MSSAGLLMTLFAGRLLRPLYRDELERLERYAQAHAAAGSDCAGVMPLGGAG